DGRRHEQHRRGALRPWSYHAVLLWGSASNPRGWTAESLGLSFSQRERGNGKVCHQGPIAATQDARDQAKALYPPPLVARRDAFSDCASVAKGFELSLLEFAVSISQSVHAIEVSVVRDRISRSLS